jgi:hypothetical protein
VHFVAQLLFLGLSDYSKPVLSLSFLTLYEANPLPDTDLLIAMPSGPSKIARRLL